MKAFEYFNYLFIVKQSATLKLEFLGTNSSHIFYYVSPEDKTAEEEKLVYLDSSPKAEQLYQGECRGPRQ